MEYFSKTDWDEVQILLKGPEEYLQYKGLL